MSMPMLKLQDGVHGYIEIRDNLLEQKIKLVFRRPWAQKPVYLPESNTLHKETINQYLEMVKKAHWAGQWEYFVVLDYSNHVIDYTFEGGVK